MGHKFLEPSQIQRSRRLGLDPFVEIGKVDVGRKRPVSLPSLPERASGLAY